MSVRTLVKSVQDIMRQDVGIDGDAQRISQLVWMFFLKIFDDREAEIEFLEDEYHSPLPEHLRWRNWAADAEGMTGEGLADGPELHSLQRAFQRNHALQCGFCTPGLLMTAYEFLRDTSNPTEEQVREGISGNICRCTGYAPIVQAILDVSQEAG